MKNVSAWGMIIVILVPEAETAKDVMDKAANIDMLSAEIINGFNVQVAMGREVAQGAMMERKSVIIVMGVESASTAIEAESASIAGEAVNKAAMQ